MMELHLKVTPPKSPLTTLSIKLSQSKLRLCLKLVPQAHFSIKVRRASIWCCQRCPYRIGHFQERYPDTRHKTSDESKWALRTLELIRSPIRIQGLYHRAYNLLHWEVLAMNRNNQEASVEAQWTLVTVWTQLKVWLMAIRAQLFRNSSDLIPKFSLKPWSMLIKMCHLQPFMDLMKKVDQLRLLKVSSMIKKAKSQWYRRWAAV